MYPRQRQAAILEAVNRDGGARIAETGRCLGVSAVTSRRDVEVLAGSGLVARVRGGAVALTRRLEATGPGRPRRTETGIARAAATLVRPGEAVGIPAGTATALLAAELLEVPGLTVVTNSIGMTVRAGFTAPDPAEAQTHALLVRAARRVVVLADHSRWGVTGVATIAPLAGADVLVSDPGLSHSARFTPRGHVGELMLAAPG